MTVSNGVNLCDPIGGGQHGVISPALRASPFRTFHVLHVRHLMCMRIPSISLFLVGGGKWPGDEAKTVDIGE